MSKKYLFFDIDGTLMAGGYEHINCPDSCLYALKKLRENGHFTAIATGRSYAMAKDIMEFLGFENMVHDGGNGITVNGKPEKIIPLDKEACVALAKECDAKNIPWAISPSNETYRVAPDSRFQDASGDTYMGTRIDENLKIEECDTIFKMYVACTREVDDTIEALNNLPHARFHDTYLFVEPTDKSVGIKKIMDRLGADYKDVIVFGDASNDLNMFIDDWTSVAMGNACEELKAKADYITTRADDNGIYNACVHFGLIEDDYFS